MQYVDHRLELLLQRPLEDNHLTAIVHQFSDLLVEGEFQQQVPNGKPGESEDPQLARLPRLVFRFNRRSQGRLRQLIDAINGG
jgi:hypothetical protein